MKYLKYIFSAVFLFFCLIGYSQTYTQPEDMISAGGGEISGGNYTNFGLIGETFDNMVLSGGNFENYLGFLYSSSYSAVGINELEYSQKTIAYPNPTNSKIYLKDINESTQRVELYNLFGQKVVESKAVKSLDISSLPKGLYLVKLIDNKGRVTRTIKVVKN